MAEVAKKVRLTVITDARYRKARLPRVCKGNTLSRRTIGERVARCSHERAEAAPGAIKKLATLGNGVGRAVAAICPGVRARVCIASPARAECR